MPLQDGLDHTMLSSVSEENTKPDGETYGTFTLFGLAAIVLIRTVIFQDSEQCLQALKKKIKNQLAPVHGMNQLIKRPMNEHIIRQTLNPSAFSFWIYHAFVHSYLSSHSSLLPSTFIERVCLAINIYPTFRLQAAKCFRKIFYSRDLVKTECVSVH